MKKTVKYATFLIVVLSVLGIGCQHLMIGNVKSSDIMGTPEFINPFVTQGTDWNEEMVEGAALCGTYESGPDLNGPQKYFFEAARITSFTILF